MEFLIVIYYIVGVLLAANVLDKISLPLDKLGKSLIYLFVWDVIGDVFVDILFYKGLL